MNMYQNVNDEALLNLVKGVTSAERAVGAARSGGAGRRAGQGRAGRAGPGRARRSVLRCCRFPEFGQAEESEKAKYK